MRHNIKEYRDGFKRVPFCTVCGQEYPIESEDCPGRKTASQYVGNKTKGVIETKST